MLSQKQAVELLDYNSATGIFVWKKRHGTEKYINSWNARYAGREAFTNSDTKGYKTGSIFGKMVKAHRVAWLICYGEWPECQVDHIDGNTSNNRAENLRSVVNSENTKNCKLSSANTSGNTGIRYRPSRGKWEASIRVDGRNIFLGRHETKDGAIMARRDAEYKYGFHINHGRR